MCFSASASFGSSLVLATLGAISIVRCRNRKAQMLAAMPFIFSIQQFAEGLVWLSANGTVSPSVGIAAANVFIFFAFVFWPVWVPFGVQRYERNKTIFQMFFSFIGLGVGASGLYFLINNSIVVTADCCHIVYQNVSSLATLSYGAWLYLLATGGSLLSSSSRIVQWFGVLLIVSYALTAVVWEYAFTSIWCFFGAIISAFIAFYSHKL